MSEGGEVVGSARQAELCQALGHPLRAAILAELADKVASPSELAAVHGVSVQGLSYHVQALLRLGCVELVGQVPRRGTIEHLYRATVRVRVLVEPLEH